MRFFIAATTAALVVGCGGDTSASSSKSTSTSGSPSTTGVALKVGMLPKLDIPYFQACRQGADDFIKAAAPAGKSARHVNIEDFHDAFFAVAIPRANGQRCAR